MYYTKNRGFENHGFLAGGFREGGYLKAEGEGVFGGCPFSIEIRTLSPIISLKLAEFLALTGIVVLVPRQHAFGGLPWAQVSARELGLGL